MDGAGGGRGDPRTRAAVGGVRDPADLSLTPSTAAGGELAELAEAPIDVAEHVYHALLRSTSTARVCDPGSAYLGAARGRAGRSWRRCRSPSVSPPIWRRRAISARSVVDRPRDRPCRPTRPGPGRGSLRAHRSAADTLPPVDGERREGVLLRALHDGVRQRWRCRWRDGPGGDHPPGLERRDKELFLEEVLGGVWTGDAAADFGHLCR